MAEIPREIATATAPTRIVTTKVIAPHSRRSAFMRRPIRSTTASRYSGCSRARRMLVASQPDGVPTSRSSPSNSTPQTSPRLEQVADAVGELDLAECSGRGLTKRREDRRRQHIPAHHGQIALGLGSGRLLHQSTHTVQLATQLGDLGTAVPGNLVFWHAHQRKDGRPNLLVSVPELAQDRWVGQRQVVGEHAEEGPVAHRVRGAEHRVARDREEKPGGPRSPGTGSRPCEQPPVRQSSPAPRGAARAADRAGGELPAPPCPRQARG